MTLTWQGTALGFSVGVGLLLIVNSALRSRRPSLDDRVLPYVRDVPLATTSWRPTLVSGRASHALLALGQPLVAGSAERLERLLGGRASIQRRLVRAGTTMTVEQFRVSQVWWGLGGFTAALIAGLLGPARSAGSAIPWLAVSVGVGIVSILARDSVLSRQVRRRESQVLAEFPVVADLLAITVAAGEGPVGAIDRVVSTCRGVLPDDLARVLAESRTGVPITVALDAFASRSGLPIVSRFAEGIAVAIDRGTPLVDVLNAQAADVREASKRSLIEAGARKEVAMMVPVVFLIMPVTLLFAFFPGVIGLNLLAP
jgi:tight adherence protein C